MIHININFLFSFTVSKFLITNGWNFDRFHRDSKMLDLSIKGGSNCKDWAELPKDVDAATGGVIQDVVVICGGGISAGSFGETFNECYSLNGKTANLFTHMSAKRKYAASLVIDKTKLWITGGWSTDTGTLASSEYITLEGSEPGPELPIPKYNHALVAIDNTLFLLIGGWTGIVTQTTHYFDHQAHNWIQGPDLMEAREDHAAGVVTDEVTTEKLVIVTGGAHNGIYLDSSEILFNNQWNQGKIAHYYSMDKGVWHGNWPIWLKFALEDANFIEIYLPTSY
jgi:hypothetical protein